MDIDTPPKVFVAAERRTSSCVDVPWANINIDFGTLPLIVHVDPSPSDITLFRLHANIVHVIADDVTRLLPLPVSVHTLSIGRPCTKRCPYVTRLVLRGLAAVDLTLFPALETLELDHCAIETLALPTSVTRLVTHGKIPVLTAHALQTVSAHRVVPPLPRFSGLFTVPELHVDTSMRRLPFPTNATVSIGQYVQVDQPVAPAQATRALSVHYAADIPATMLPALQTLTVHRGAPAPMNSVTELALRGRHQNIYTLNFPDPASRYTVTSAVHVRGFPQLQRLSLSNVRVHSVSEVPALATLSLDCATVDRLDSGGAKVELRNGSVIG